MADMNIELRDIHLPQQLDWWPLAPAWWWLIGISLLVIIAVCVIIIYLKRQARFKHLRRQARRELSAIGSRYADDHHAAHCLSSVSILLKRVCLSLYPRDRVAGLHGDAWLEFLSSTASLSGQQIQALQLLRTGPYQQQVSEADLQALLQAVENYLLHLNKPES